jgi:REP element-mobilizing transposase RayT
MARPLRLEFAGALYHVTTQGNGRADIVLSDYDRRLFLDVLGGVCERFGWRVHAYCLMTNHYHLLVETPDANLAKGMRQLNGVYTQRFNRTHGRFGHVFQGRYKAIVVQKEAYLLGMARHIVLNPVRAGIVPSPSAWPWSSYLATIGAQPAPEWLESSAILGSFGKTHEGAVPAYMRFIAEGKGQLAPWAGTRQQIFLGSTDFVASLQRRVPANVDLREIPQAKSRPAPIPLADFARQHPTRDHAIAAAYASGAYTMRDIGDYFDLHYSRISKIVRAASASKIRAKH